MPTGARTISRGLVAKPSSHNFLRRRVAVVVDAVVVVTWNHSNNEIASVRLGGRQDALADQRRCNARQMLPKHSSASTTSATLELQYNRSTRGGCVECVRRALSLIRHGNQSDDAVDGSGVIQWVRCCAWTRRSAYGTEMVRVISTKDGSLVSIPFMLPVGIVYIHFYTRPPHHRVYTACVYVLTSPSAFNLNFKCVICYVRVYDTAIPCRSHLVTRPSDAAGGGWRWCIYT